MWIKTSNDEENTKAKKDCIIQIKPETDMKHSYQEEFESGILNSLLLEVTALGLLSPAAAII